MNTTEYHSIAKVLQAVEDWERAHSRVNVRNNDPLGYTSHRKRPCHFPMAMPLNKEITDRTGLTTDQLDTLFQRWAGVDLPRFMQGLSLSHTRKRLQETRNLLAASLSGNNLQQAYRTCCQVRTVPCAQKKRRGKGTKTPELTIKYGVHPSPFGHCLVAISGREICHLSFVDGQNWILHLQELQHNWPQARIIAETDETGRQVTERIFTPTEDDPLKPLSLLFKGSPLQLKVWHALLTLPKGAMICYQDLAALVGHPTAWRAVASAVAANPVGYLIPCHRVIRKSGEINHYRWGSIRKKALLGWEACGLKDTAPPSDSFTGATQISMGLKDKKIGVRL